MTARGGSVCVDLLVEPAKSQSGIGRYVEHLGAGLVDAGVDVGFAQFRYLPGADRRESLKAVPIGVQRHRKDCILHIPKIAGSSVLLRPGRGTSVVTAHDLGALYCPEDQPLISRFGRETFRLALMGMKRASHVIAVSDFTRRDLIRFGIAPERVTTVHEGVDLERFRPVPNAVETASARFGIDFAAQPVLLYVGNELPRKNLSALVRAIGLLREVGQDVLWLKVGGPGWPPGRRDLDRVIDDVGVRERVRFLDHVSDADLAALYSAATVYVQPSVWEGFGLPVLEAMACGTPVIAHDGSALPEICGDAGLRVNAREPQTLASLLAVAIEDSTLRAEQSRLGRKNATRFSWAHAAGATRAIYSTLL